MKTGTKTGTARAIGDQAKQFCGFPRKVWRRDPPPFLATALPPTMRHLGRPKGDPPDTAMNLIMYMSRMYAIAAMFGAGAALSRGRRRRRLEGRDHTLFVRGSTGDAAPAPSAAPPAVWGASLASG
jgi:hypothetical protein